MNKPLNKHKRSGLIRMTGQAPEGGVTIEGKFFPGGEFIPGRSQTEVDKAAVKPKGGKKTTPRKAKKLTIKQAVPLLKEMGIELVGGLQPKLVDGKFVTQFRIKRDGKTEIVTGKDIREIITGNQ